MFNSLILHNQHQLNIDNMPIVVWIGHSIHGNEPSGANASFIELLIIWPQHRENK